MAHIIFDRCRKLKELTKTHDLGVIGNQEADSIDFQVTNAGLFYMQKNYHHKRTSDINVPQLAETGKEVTFWRNFLRRYQE